ncbi:FAD:protein FMN transferase [Actinomadura citrea]|uniref:FAD:protein FMN transferase n=1 Tax=Actinomadura citrea TaxID=46158 RepID=A0A7Y9KD58_9ACTN|nr:FAD:protein FMN transferase [Actinomadura citrea]NYE13026.1 thiamine biosynthesis lipoprotein [Actinomadura citrea]
MAEGIRHVEHVMGTAFSFDIRTPRSPSVTAALARAVAWLHHVDRVFSPYRPDSQVTRLADGRVGVGGCDPEVAEVLRLGAEFERITGGAFTCEPGGRLDPSGVVKGWAIERASTILHDAGAHDHCVNGGGDVQARGEAGPGDPWRIGIADPRDRSGLIAAVSGRDIAVATSGTAERGRHILDPRTGRPATGLASVTLVGRHLTEVDALATAAFAMGGAARAWAEARPGIEAFGVTSGGRPWWTPGFEDIALLPCDLA